MLEHADVIRPDGAQVPDPAYGAAAKGLLMVDAEGRYSLQIFRPGRTRFASGDKKKGTAAEYQEALQGISTHTGRIMVDDAGRTLVFQIDCAAFPNWEHTEQRRAFQLEGDLLTYRVPAAAGGLVPVSVWRRVR